jgi:hypothetical protein
MASLSEGSEPYLADKLKEYLAGFAPGSRRQSETKKCATAMKYEWYQAAVTHLCLYVRAVMLECDATLEAVRKYHASHGNIWDEFSTAITKGQDRERKQIEQLDKAVTVTMVDDYQLKSVS